MPNYNNGYNNGFGNNAFGNNNSYSNNYNSDNNQSAIFGLTPQQIVQYFQQGRLVWSDFVQGRAGADAYPLPPGITMARLWDNDTNRFYVKGYDNNGRPRVLADNDFAEHFEPDPQPVMPQIDLSSYATKEDIAQMINEALSKFGNNRPNMQGYVTQKELNKALSSLSVGNGGRIVRDNESNA